MTNPEERKAIVEKLQDSIGDIADFCNRFGLVDRKGLLPILEMVKTIAQFSRMLKRAVLELWRGTENEFEFIDRMTYAIDEQYRRAWNEGMRSVGLDPVRDMLAEWENVLNARIEQEYNYVLDFADAILKAREEGGPVDALYSRAELWVSRYEELRNLAMVTCGREKRLVWQLGVAEHCDTCLALHGIVAYARVWEASPWRPQGRNLRCGGFNCKCSLSPTDDPPTGKQPGDVSG